MRPWPTEYCPHCEKPFENIHSLARHVAADHKMGLNSNGGGPPRQRRLPRGQRRCVDCLAIFSHSQRGGALRVRCATCRAIHERKLSAIRVDNWVERNRKQRLVYMREYYRRRLGITQDRYRPNQYKAVD